jgi:uncharacterized protein
MSLFSSRPWYVGGLAFECSRCGKCCAGPQEGYVWVTPGMIDEIAGSLKMPADEFRRRYTRKVGSRVTIVEDPVTHDCVFLGRDAEGLSTCSIYAVRPLQCRTWPFWPVNLRNTDAWNDAAGRCPGINRGQLHEYTEIQYKRDRSGT